MGLQPVVQKRQPFASRSPDLPIRMPTFSAQKIIEEQTVQRRFTKKDTRG